MQKIDLIRIMNTSGVSKELILEFAFQTGLIKRQRMISPSDLLFAICSESTNGTVSYNDLAAQIEADNGVSVSRQAVWKKVTEPCESFFQKILEIVILNKVDKGDVETLRHSSQYKRVLVQDSTIIKLPVRLFDIFSGVSNGHTKVCNARIQGTYDLLAEKFISFSIDPYSKNDLSAAAELSIQKDDLVLRDRGYLILDEIQRHVSKEAHCIFRHKFGMILLDPVTEKQIDILAELEKKNNLDIEVMLNNKSRTVVRFVAAPVSEEVANKRRMKAKKENKTPPSKEYLKLMSWSIFITTIPKKQAGFITIFNIYSFRWRIEIIFKSWKSNLEFDKIHNVSKTQLSVILLARFIMIIIFTQNIFHRCRVIVKKHLNKDLSLLKVIHYLSRNLNKIRDIYVELTQYTTFAGKTICVLARYCSYDKRARENFEQKMDAVFGLS